ncbi:MAG: 4Fe-4S dicluster domain-containing protein [Thermoplasmata archaeon]|nr:MAG: 4Fe-4S dicluster domain-containing protein [Thermoplasmata archaeon]
MKFIKIEPDKCTGCMLCALACSLIKKGECNPHRAAIRIERNEFDRYEVPLLCVQCEEAVCLQNCPQNAYSQDESGIITHDPKRCILCGLCALLCPNIGINYTGSELIKCDLCYGSPVCVKFCSTGAIEFVESESVPELAREHHVHRILISKRVSQSGA